MTPDSLAATAVVGSRTTWQKYVLLRRSIKKHGMKKTQVLVPWYREYGKYSSHGIGSTGVRTYLTNYKSTLEQIINNAGRPGGLVVALECYLS